MISFPEFFAAIHGYDPYPWQERFADRCLESGAPSMVSTPTGTGKTAVVDALVWALAAQADRPAAERTVGVRTIWAIDRRILVDEVHEHVTALAKRLEAAAQDEAEVLHGPASALAALSNGRPLVATRWRGGVHEHDELLGPVQPQVITSTVAQAGSRLLFRGYGVGRGSLALQAGLVACDTTICLDEAHLAEPFAQTVAAVSRLREASERAVELPRLRSVTLTATPGELPPDAITLSPEDEEMLGEKITAPKWVSLDDTATSDSERAARLTEATASYIDEGLSSVACVVNTVKQAREVFKRLKKRFASDDVTVALLIGPQRPADRDRLLKGSLEALLKGTAPGQPLICVATQTFEVGLDVDVSGMVSESASAAALIQRLGRLNRRGKNVGRATIVRDEGSWLYGEDEERAWRWLSNRVGENGIDASVITLDRDEARPEPSLSPHAPALTADVVKQLVQTNPLPGSYQDPDVEPFLSGAESEPSADVSVIWRCDLRLAAITGEDDEYREMLLKLVPPQPQEKLTLSLHSARALLAALYPAARERRRAALTTALTDSDVEGRTTEKRPPDLAEEAPGRPYVVIRGDEIRPGSLGKEENAIAPSMLQPGDVIALPTAAGGVDDHGLTVDPKSRAEDVALDLVREEEDAEAGGDGAGAPEEPADDKAGNRTGQEAVPGPVRVSPEVLSAMLTRPLRQGEWRSITRTSDSAVSLLSKLKGIVPESPAIRALDHLPDGTTLEVRAVDTSEPEEFDSGPSDQAEDSVEPEEVDESTADEPAAHEGPSWVLLPISTRRPDQRDRSVRTPPPTLAAHAESVRARVDSYLAALGLPEQTAAALEWAARAHDHGKADPRIQRFFYGGVAPIGAELIAKSVFGTRDPARSRLAATIAGLPRGLHHEIASAAILAAALAENRILAGDQVDSDLCLHLVACHHGRGRPIPAVASGGSPPRRFSCDVAGAAGAALGDGTEAWMNGEDMQRFWTVIDRYGAWGAAYLEAVLILADRTVSSEGN